MPRAFNPLSPRNRNRQFTVTGAQVAEIVKLAASKRARVVRQRSDFNMRDLAALLRAPIISGGGGSWTIEQIIHERDAQMAGRFRGPVRLAESMGTDDALFTAKQVRLGPVQSLGVKIDPGPKAKGDSIATEAEALFGNNGIAVSDETITTLRKHLVDHGVAIGYNEWTSRADGSRVDVVHRAWPLEFVWWHETANCYVTQTRRVDADPDPQPGAAIVSHGPPGAWQIEPIIHGNGRWVVYAKSEILPHRDDAAILPAAMVWARHAFGKRDWAKGSAAHGNAKVVGELPENTPLTDEAGDLTEEAAAYLTLVQAVAAQDSPAGIRPNGAKLDYITNSSAAWEVWARLIEVEERAAARIYLGTDGVLGAQGGAPGVDIDALFGVAASKIQSDLACIEKNFQSGVMSPWTAINFGDDKLAPSRRYVFPDPDESRVREDFAKRTAAFFADLKAAKECALVVDQALVDRLADLHGVPAPRVMAATTIEGEAPANDVAASRGHLVPIIRRVVR